MSEPADDAARAEHEVEEIRDRLTGIVRELDRRRHALLDVRGQLRRHAPAVGVSAGSLVLLTAGAVWLGVWLKARRQRPMAKVHRLRLALGRAIAHPEDLARPQPGVGAKVFSAAVSATIAVLAKTLSQRLVRELKEAPTH